MLVCVLASGSKGNSTLIRTKDYNLLVDAGMTAQYLERKLNENNLKLTDIDCILLTHTHNDHTSALKSIIKKSKVNIVLTKEMHRSLKYLNEYENLIYIDVDLEIDNILIESITTSHDSPDSRGYIITEGESSAVVITDTGYINQKHFDKIKNKSVYVFESNHDVEMLMHGKYPKWLKKRVYGDLGHLSNESSSYYLSKIIGPNTKQIVLAHLSEENNTPEIALENIRSYFAEHNIEFDNIITAPQNEQTKQVEV